MNTVQTASTTVDTATTPTLVKRAAPLPGYPQRRGSTLVWHLLVLLVVGGLVFGLTFLLEPFRNYQLATIAAYVCVAAGLTMLTGLSGQLSLGHGALMATGAYSVALLSAWFSERDMTALWVLPVSLFAGVLVATLAGLIVGLAAARLRGPYLAGVTLALAIIVPAVAVTFESVFNGEQGLQVFVPPMPEALTGDVSRQQWEAWIGLAAAALVLLLLANLNRSRFGRSLRAVRDDEVAARLSGIHLARAQVAAFMVSAACAGLAGGVIAVLYQLVVPGSFSLLLSLSLLLAIVVGGLGSLTGAVWGAAVLVFLPDIAHNITESIEMSPALSQRLEGNLSQLIFGLVLITVMIAAPGGIQGLVRRVGAWGRSRLGQRSANQSTGADAHP